MGASPFRGLVAYERAVRLADELYAEVVRWPRFERWSIGLQTVRAADSVGANIAEASGRWHRPDQRRLLLVARGSLYELEHWLTRAHARGLTPHDHAEDLAQTARALNGLIRRNTSA